MNIKLIATILITVLILIILLIYVMYQSSSKPEQKPELEKGSLQYTEHIGQDSFGNDISNSMTSSLDEAKKKCDSIPNCKLFTRANDGMTYFKHTAGPLSSFNGNVYIKSK